MEDHAISKVTIIVFDSFADRCTRTSLMFARERFEYAASSDFGLLFEVEVIEEAAMYERRVAQKVMFVVFHFDKALGVDQVRLLRQELQNTFKHLSHQDALGWTKVYEARVTERASSELYVLKARG